MMSRCEVYYRLAVGSPKRVFVLDLKTNSDRAEEIPDVARDVELLGVEGDHAGQKTKSPFRTIATRNLTLMPKNICTVCAAGISLGWESAGSGFEAKQPAA